MGELEICFVISRLSVLEHRLAQRTCQAVLQRGVNLQLAGVDDAEVSGSQQGEDALAVDATIKHLDGESLPAGAVCNDGRDEVAAEPLVEWG